MRNVAREQADHVIFVYGSARRLSQAAATAPVNAPRGRPDPPFASGGDHYAENADAILGNWLGVRFEGKDGERTGRAAAAPWLVWEERASSPRIG